MRKHRYKLTGLVAAVFVLFVALTAGNAYLAQTASSAAAAPVTNPSPSAIPSPATPTPASTSSTTPETTEESAETTLVVYFSYEGSTAQLAGFVHDRVGGDLYEIVPATPYSEDFDATADLAREEQRNGVYPEVAGEAFNTDQYDTIFLGHPNWWGEQPMVVQTFMREHDLNEKTIVPFISHDGSRFGNSLTVLEEYYPNATIREGFAIRGDEVSADASLAQQSVEGWLTGLGF